MISTSCHWEGFQFKTGIQNTHRTSPIPLFCWYLCGFLSLLTTIYIACARPRVLINHHVGGRFPRKDAFVTLYPTVVSFLERQTIAHTRIHPVFELHYILDEKRLVLSLLCMKSSSYIPESWSIYGSAIYGNDLDAIFIMIRLRYFTRNNNVNARRFRTVLRQSSCNAFAGLRRVELLQVSIVCTVNS